MSKEMERIEKRLAGYKKLVNISMPFAEVVGLESHHVLMSANVYVEDIEWLLPALQEAEAGKWYLHPDNNAKNDPPYYGEGLTWIKYAQKEFIRAEKVGAERDHLRIQLDEATHYNQVEKERVKESEARYNLELGRANKAENQHFQAILRLTELEDKFPCSHRKVDWDDSYGHCAACVLKEYADKYDDQLGLEEKVRGLEADLNREMTYKEACEKLEEGIKELLVCCSIPPHIEKGLKELIEGKERNDEL